MPSRPRKKTRAKRRAAGRRDLPAEIHTVAVAAGPSDLPAEIRTVAAIRSDLPVEIRPVARIRSDLPAEIRSVAAHGKISQVAVSDDGELIAIASMSADRRAPTLAVHRTRDGSEVCAYTVDSIAGNGKAACFDSAGDLLFVAGDTLYRLKTGGQPERLGRVESESMFRDAAGGWLAFVERGGAVRFVPASAPLDAGWRHDPGRGHFLFGTQVRFVGGTSRALVSGLADHGPLLIDVPAQAILREYPHKGACADASHDGAAIVVFEPKARHAGDWAWIYRGDAPEATPIPKDTLGAGGPIAFAPDGEQLVKTGAGVELVALAGGDARALPDPQAQPGSTYTPAVLARGAPLIAWSSFNFGLGDFRASWASFPTSTTPTKS